jgi:hypothetical protein
MKRLFSILLGGLLLSATLAASAAGDRTPSSTSPPIITWRAPAFYTSPHSGRTALTDAASPMPYIPLVPCREYDSRGSTKLVEATPRTVTLSAAPCGVPATAVAVAVNITVFNISGGSGNGVFKVDTVSPPVTAWINYPSTETQRGNAGVLSTFGAAAIVVAVYQSGGSVDFTVDVFGYYSATPANTADTFTVINTSGVGAIHGLSTNSNGVWGESTNWDGVYALGGRFGVNASGASQGVVGVATGATGVQFGLNGAIVSTTAGAAGVLGQAAGGPPVNYAQNVGTSLGVFGVAKGSTYAVVGVSNPAGWAGHFITQDPTTGNLLSEVLLAPNSSIAAAFYGNVSITSSAGGAGTLNVLGFITKAGGGFKIDDPLDPENKYLYHSFVESPDMMNIYNGIIELDALGEAIVQLPAYFEALNKDFRYQLTSIGQSQPNLYVADEIQNLQFRIAGGKPHAKASWQVTGVRQDPVANANRYISEVAKEPEAKGYYLHTAAYKQPADKDLTRRMMEVQKAREIEKARNESSQ